MIEPQAARVRRAPPVLAAVLAACAAVPSVAKEPPAPRVLDAEHVSPSGRLRFRTPAGWKVTTRPAMPETMDAIGDGVRVRFVFQDGEHGLDSLHSTCMLDRLAPEADASLQISYEYDFIGMSFGDRRALDSAFSMRYDDAIDGHRQWRQRNVTVVGSGSSLCAISYVPAALWKKSKETRALVDAIMGSVSLP
jgi:hypothetical protein